MRTQPVCQLVYFSDEKLSICFFLPGGTCSVGHSRSGGLWSLATTLLPRHGRHSHVLLHRQPRQLGEHPREVDTRGTTLLPQCSHHSGRQQKGSAQWWKHQTRADEDETGTGTARGRTCHGRKDQCLLIPGVLSQNQGGCEGGVWDGHSGSSADQEEEEGWLHCVVSAAHWGLVKSGAMGSLAAKSTVLGAGRKTSNCMPHLPVLHHCI